MLKIRGGNLEKKGNGNRCRSDLAVLYVILYSAWGLIQDKVPGTAPLDCRACAIG
jgi:hypothetical protein